jgi:hypothetical protein
MELPMSVALQDAVGPRTTRLSVLVSNTEAEEIANRAKAADLSVSAYLRAQSLIASASENEPEALAVFDQIITDITSRIDAANTSLEAALSRLKP